MPPFDEHSQRFALTNELHARPFIEVAAPAQISHLAVLCNPADALSHLTRLCDQFGVNPPQADAQHFVGDFGAFRLQWERHTEFATFSVIGRGGQSDPFADPVITQVPEDWTGALPGEVLVALHIGLLDRNMASPTTEQLERWFVPASLASSMVTDDAAQVWADFRIHGDGYGRMLVHDHRLSKRQTGRVVQRLLELETYRTMALLGLPVARRVAPDITRIDQALAALTQGIRQCAEAGEEQRLLGQLNDLSAEIEAIASASSYRFGASEAYDALVAARLAKLRESRVQGFQTLGEFLDRRLAPAMRTCRSVAQRQATLSERATRAANLLRTRVDIELAEQNRDLLRSMNRRARLQLRLQQTVEGLSVAAITYYVVSLVSYIAKAAKSAGLPVVPDLWTGLSTVPVLLLVWLGVRRMRHVIARSAIGDSGENSKG
ncbi:MAG: DUF3422 domain-containing protein [Alphaproteobacteria bacterium]|nr:DUF3422 domain-containing protein [Alphaproteobacteria bacterium]